MKVLISSLDNWNTSAEIPFILERAGCTVHVHCRKNDWLRSNRFHAKWIEANDRIQPFLTQLKQLASEDYDWIILCDEPLLILVKEQVEEEALLRKLLPLIDISFKEILGSKAGFSTTCDQLGILTPQFEVIRDPQNFRGVSKSFTWPVIVKEDLGWGGGTIVTCRTDGELNDTIKQFAKPVIIQQYIVGREVPVEALFYWGKLVSYASSEILAYDKHEFSYSTRRKYFSSDLYEQIIRDAGSKLGIHGFVNIALIQSKSDGHLYFIEADIRPNSWMPYCRFCGRDFANALRQHLKGKENGISETAVSKDPMEIMLFYKDLRRCIYKRDFKGFSQWMINYRGCWKFIPFYDRRLLGRIIRELFDEFITSKFRGILKSKQAGSS